MLARFLLRNFLEEDEKIIQIFRPPFVFIIHKLVFRLVFCGVLFVVLYRLKLWDIDFLWLLPLFLGAYWSLGLLLHWFVNGVVMTNEGLVFVTWPSFFVRKYERIDFHNLDEIEVERHGVAAYFMNYGTLIFQKINGGEEIKMHRMGRPVKTSRAIEHYREMALDDKNFTEESALKGLLSQIVQKHVEDAGQPHRPEEKILRSKSSRFQSWRGHKTEHDHEEIQTHHHIDRAKQSTHERQDCPKTVESSEEGVSLGARASAVVDKPIQKKTRPKKKTSEPEVLVEKKLDDTGGLELDLSDD